MPYCVDSHCPSHPRPSPEALLCHLPLMRTQVSTAAVPASSKAVTRFNTVSVPRGAESTSFATVGRRVGRPDAAPHAHGNVVTASIDGPTNFTTIGRRAGPPGVGIEKSNKT